ncbi:MAG TPA: Gfo/Idh/MocA family oxidoreductase [Polyangiaceae bacterium]|nr:Gfo/Idh/MocA family oxidoreductase [Polyangiaceae bacterium]
MTDLNLPRVGALGVGWIGASRLAALSQSGQAEIVGICDPNPEACEKARACAPSARIVQSYDELLALDLDAVVIATPSGLHAEQCLRAFDRGVAVFCQKPLTRSSEEAEAVLRAAQSSDRLLRVDFCYRQTQALSKLREVVQSGSLGRVYAVDLVFHNAYGPDKAWANDANLAGGGCLIDLGVHLVDAAFWVLGAGHFERAHAQLFKQGQPLLPGALDVEDFALGELETESSVNLRLACSWRSSFGTHARIRAEVFGTQGSATFANVDGSFYDFSCDLHRGAHSERLVSPPDAWGDRAIVAFASELRESPRYRATDELLLVSRAIDALYGRRTVWASSPVRRARADSATGSVELNSP